MRSASKTWIKAAGAVTASAALVMPLTASPAGAATTAATQLNGGWAPFDRCPVDAPAMLAADGDGDDLAAGRVEGALHHLVVLVLARADDQPLAQLEGADAQRRGGVDGVGLGGSDGGRRRALQSHVCASRGDGECSASV